VSINAASLINQLLDDKICSLPTITRHIELVPQHFTASFVCSTPRDVCYRQWFGFHDSVTLLRLRMRLNIFGRNSAWNWSQHPRTTILDLQSRGLSTRTPPTRRTFDKRRRRKAVQLAAAGGALTAATFLSDEIKHGYSAAERSARVITTLTICVNEFVFPALIP
jgi:hypothetical protein